MTSMAPLMQCVQFNLQAISKCKLLLHQFLWVYMHVMRSLKKKICTTLLVSSVELFNTVSAWLCDISHEGTTNESALNIATPLLCIVPRGTNNISVDYLIICKWTLWKQMAEVQRKVRKSTEVLSELLREVTGCLPAFYRAVDSSWTVCFINKCLNKQSSRCKKPDQETGKLTKWWTAVFALWNTVCTKCTAEIFSPLGTRMSRLCPKISLKASRAVLYGGNHLVYILMPWHQTLSVLLLLRCKIHVHP